MTQEDTGKDQGDFRPRLNEAAPVPTVTVRRQLEKSGFVSSFWDTSESGPARRMYSLTKAGDIFLSGWIEALQNYQKVVQQALASFEPPAAQDGDDEGDAPGEAER